MGTFREMAVSGQTSSHQDRKWLEGCVRKSVSVCFCIIRPAGDQLSAAQTEATTVSHDLEQ